MRQVKPTGDFLVPVISSGHEAHAKVSDFAKGAGLAQLATDAGGVATFKELTRLHGDIPADFMAAPTYVQRAYQNTLLVNGIEENQSLVAQSWHDLFQGTNSLINPLTSKPNIMTINHGQQLVAIPGASSAPYWTDPGAVTLSANSGTIPASLPGMIDFETINGKRACRISTPVGYGDAAGGKRRTQITFNSITSRVRVAWHLQFFMPDTDDMPYDAASGYKYPVLIWQHKGAAQPVMALTVESKGDGVHYTLLFSMKYSCDASDVSTYKRQYNEFGSGNLSAQSGSTRYFQVDFKKNELMDVIIDSFLDERKMDSISDGGRGFINAYVNGAQVLTYAGPTLTYRDTAGAAPFAHAWMIGLYRTENAAPVNLKELDLTRQTDPAPYRREIVFSEARLLSMPQ